MQALTEPSPSGVSVSYSENCKNSRPSLPFPMSHLATAPVCVHGDHANRNQWWRTTTACLRRQWVVHTQGTAPPHGIFVFRGQWRFPVLSVTCSTRLQILPFGCDGHLWYWKLCGWKCFYHIQPFYDSVQSSFVDVWLSTVRCHHSTSLHPWKTLTGANLVYLAQYTRYCGLILLTDVFSEFSHVWASFCGRSLLLVGLVKIGKSLPPFLLAIFLCITVV